MLSILAPKWPKFSNVRGVRSSSSDCEAGAVTQSGAGFVIHSVHDPFPSHTSYRSILTFLWESLPVMQNPPTRFNKYYILYTNTFSALVHIQLDLKNCNKRVYSDRHRRTVMQLGFTSGKASPKDPKLKFT